MIIRNSLYYLLILLTGTLGYALINVNSHADRFYIIKSGWIKLFRETLDGVQAVVDILSVGHI